MGRSLLRRIALLSILGFSSAQVTSSWGEPFTVANSALTTPGASLAVATSSPTVPLASESSVTLPGIQSAISTVTFDPSTSATTGALSVSSSGSAPSVQSSAAAAAAPVGFNNMGVVGAVAGAVGVLFI